MTDKIQDPFEDFPDKDIDIWEEGRLTNGMLSGEVAQIEGYSEEIINIWRSKHETEIKHNTETVKRLQEVYNQNKVNVQLYYLTGFDLVRILEKILNTDGAEII